MKNFLGQKNGKRKRILELFFKRNFANLNKRNKRPQKFILWRVYNYNSLYFIFVKVRQQECNFGLLEQNYLKKKNNISFQNLFSKTKPPSFMNFWWLYLQTRFNLLFHLNSKENLNAKYFVQFFPKSKLQVLFSFIKWHKNGRNNHPLET